MKRMFKQGLSLLLSLILICSLVQGAAATTLNEANTGSGEQAKRTILFYVCGSDLETESGLASFNIKQVLDANFSADDDVKFIVMTGGSLKWNLESQYLCDPNGLGLSVDEETGEYTISSEYNPYAEYKRAREDRKMPTSDSGFFFCYLSFLYGYQSLGCYRMLVIHPYGC